MNVPATDSIAEILRTRTSVLDGATATMLTEASAAAHLPMADLLCLVRPETVTALHNAYLDAGADIIGTNTFNTNAFTLKRRYLIDHPDRTAEVINRTAADLACQCTRRATARDGYRRYVAGVVTPICPRPSDSADEWMDACQAQMAALAESGLQCNGQRQRNPAHRRPFRGPIGRRGRSFALSRRPQLLQWSARLCSTIAKA